MNEAIIFMTCEQKDMKQTIYFTVTSDAYNCWYSVWLVVSNPRNVSPDSALLSILSSFSLLFWLV